MSLRINTNVTAMNALRNLGNISTQVSASIGKLSSGLRINNASDDPAGLIISESLRAQVDGLNQAISNSQDAANVIKTAEGGLTEVNSLLRNVRQLAVHASNSGVNDQVAIQADQTQINSAVASIQRIAEQTQFGTKHLLDGSSGIAAATVNTAQIGGVVIGGTFNGAATQNGQITISVTTAATRASVTGGNSYASVNATIGSVASSGGTIVLNGQSITTSASDTVQSLLNKINSVTASTGVSANFSGGTVVLTSTDYGTNSAINVNESASILGGTGTTPISASASGTNAVVTVTATALINGAVTTTNATFTGGRGAGDSGLRVTDTYGNAILLTEQGNTTSTTNSAVANVTAGSLQFQVGANAGQTVTASLGNIRTSNLGNTTVAGKSLATVDVTTTQGATDTIKITDEAIQQVSNLRATLGAFQKSTLESTVRSLGVGAENLSASESQIRDTNVASEVVNLTKNQILQSAANSVLSQANSAPQSVLSLLR